MIENERLVKIRKKNMKLYPFYRDFASDINMLSSFYFLIKLEELVHQV